MNTQRPVGPGTTSSGNYARSSNRWQWKLHEPQLRPLYPPGLTIVIRCSTACRTLYCASYSLCRTPLHVWSLARDAVIISRRYYANSTGCPSDTVSSSNWHAWFASRCPGKRLSTWQTTAASCPTALGALCGQLMFRLAWGCEHSAVRTTEFLQPRDFACGPLFRSSCAIQTLPTDWPDDSWKDTFFEPWTGRSVTSDMLAP